MTDAKLLQAAMDASEFGMLGMRPIRSDAGGVEDFQIVLANAMAATLTGRSKEHLVDSTLLTEFPANLETGLFDRYAATLETGAEDGFEIAYAKDGVVGRFAVKARRATPEMVVVEFTPVPSYMRRAKALERIQASDRAQFGSHDDEIASLLRVGVDVLGVDAGVMMRVDAETTSLAHSQGPRPSDADTAEIGRIARDACEADCVRAETTASGLRILAGPCPDLTGAGDADDGPRRAIAFFAPAGSSLEFNDDDRRILSYVADAVARARRLRSHQRRLKALQDELRLVIDSIPAKIFYKDDQNRILLANAEAAQSLGYDDPRALDGADTRDLFPGMAEKYHADDLAVLDSERARRNIIETYAPKDGAQRWLSTDKIPLRDESGRRRLLAIAVDITELKEQQEQLETLNQGLKDFAAVASHDLQSPLRRVGVFSEILVRALDEAGLSVPERARTAISGIVASVDHMRNMIASIHELSRLSATDISLAPVDLNAVVAASVADVMDEVEDGALHVAAQSLPTVPGDANLLQLFFSNLLRNAHKYKTRRQAQVEITHSFDAGRRRHVIAVADDGPGVPRELQDVVFEPFRRGPGAKSTDGSGIGLALCRKISAAHRGGVSIDGDAPTGLRIVLEIPPL